ncbi:Holliday junction resolvase RuvX [Spirochaetota bacterium]
MVRKSKVLGLDIGTKRIGCAVAYADGIAVRTLDIIQRRGDFSEVSNIKKIIEDENISLIVIGLPYNMDGSEGKRIEDARLYAGELKKRLRLDIDFQDERLSTVEAERMISHLKSKKRSKLKKNIDSIAAEVILRDYLQT